MSIASPLVLCIKIGKKVVGDPASFALDNMLFRKLFTAHKGFNPYSKDLENEENQVKQSTFANYLNTRASFYYSYKGYCR